MPYMSFCFGVVLFLFSETSSALDCCAAHRLIRELARLTSLKALPTARKIDFNFLI